MGLAIRKETTGVRRGRWSWTVWSVASLAVESVEAEVGAKSMVAVGNAERGLPRSEENRGVAAILELLAGKGGSSLVQWGCRSGRRDPESESDELWFECRVVAAGGWRRHGH
ncbi:hypothetical protein MLD38_004561 [Melastoma candidum]|uniref:Uncharacterized protein n=1 Tax=Melastoma candidum TaxID=119954 RepID=A0ACB9S6W8_9MYRT|nr:hypothetical protein MLD38_004561 [Melastoma candidum]